MTHNKKAIDPIRLLAFSACTIGVVSAFLRWFIGDSHVYIDPPIIANGTQLLAIAALVAAAYSVTRNLIASDVIVAICATSGAVLTWSAEGAITEFNSRVRDEIYSVGEALVITRWALLSAAILLVLAAAVRWGGGWESADDESKASD
jgi:hypothetical protein